jgi:hypothetical protein
MQRIDLPVEVGVADRLRVSRALLNAAHVAEQARQPVPTDEAEFIGIRNRNTPVQRNASTAPKAEELISLAMQAQQLYNRTPSPGNPASTPGSSLSSVRSSLLVTPPSIRNPSRNTPGTVTSHGSLMPRNQTGQQSFSERATRHGKK